MISNPIPILFASDDAQGTAQAATPGPRILVVEDDFLVALQIETALVEAGFSVVGVALSADEAVALSARRTPELIIMDIHLVGNRDGIDAALQIFRECGIRCIFATAHSDANVRKRAEPAAPLAWLQKPYTSASLVETVERALVEKR